MPEEAQTVRETTTQATPKRGKSVNSRCRLSTYDDGIVVHAKSSFHCHITGTNTNKTSIVYTRRSHSLRGTIDYYTTEEVCMLVRSLFKSTTYTVRRVLCWNSMMWMNRHRRQTQRLKTVHHNRRTPIMRERRNILRSPKKRWIRPKSRSLKRRQKPVCFCPDNKQNYRTHMIVSRFKKWKGASKKIEDEGKVIKSFKFDIEALQDRAQEWIISLRLNKRWIINIGKYHTDFGIRHCYLW